MIKDKLIIYIILALLFLTGVVFGWYYLSQDKQTGPEPVDQVTQRPSDGDETLTTQNKLNEPKPPSWEIESPQETPKEDEVPKPPKEKTSPKETPTEEPLREELPKEEKSPTSIQPIHYGDLDYSHLTTAEGLVLPDKIVGSLDLDNLTTAEGLTLPETISGGLYLRTLTTAEGLVLPTEVGGNLYLNFLTTAEGLVLPTEVGGDLDLGDLTSAEGLVLPTEVSGGLYLDLSLIHISEPTRPY